MALKRGVYFQNFAARCPYWAGGVMNPPHSYTHTSLYTNEVTYPAYYTSILNMEGAYTSETSTALLRIQPMRTLTN
jgi:hypothetical protein